MFQFPLSIWPVHAFFPFWQGHTFPYCICLPASFQESAGAPFLLESLTHVMFRCAFRGYCFPAHLLQHSTSARTVLRQVETGVEAQTEVSAGMEADWNGRTSRTDRGWHETIERACPAAAEFGHTASLGVRSRTDKELSAACFELPQATTLMGMWQATSGAHARSVWSCDIGSIRR